MIISLRFQELDGELIKRVADNRNPSVSEFIRSAIQSEIEKEFKTFLEDVRAEQAEA